MISTSFRALLREEAVDPLPLDLEIQMKGLIEEIKCLLNCRKVLFNDGEGSLLSALNKMNDCSVSSIEACPINFHTNECLIFEGR